jgi:hypothetical protein
MMILHGHCIHCNNMKTYINIDFFITCCYKANEALHQFFGSHFKQYRLINKYMSTILNTNPSSSSYVQSENACHLKGEYEK